MGAGIQGLAGRSTPGGAAGACFTAANRSAHIEEMPRAGFNGFIANVTSGDGSLPVTRQLHSMGYYRE